MAQRDDRGQEAHRADEGDQHADAGDQAQLRHPGEVGRHEGQESGGGGGGGDQDLPAGPARGGGQRFGLIGELEPRLAVADAELDGEIDGDADEQDAKPD